MQFAGALVMHAAKLVSDLREVQQTPCIGADVSVQAPDEALPLPTARAWLAP